MKNFLKVMIVIMSLCFTACLDDKDAVLDPSGSQNVIEFLNITTTASPVGAVHPVMAPSFPVVEETSFDIIVSYSGPNSNNKDIEVELGYNPLALLEYNEEQSTSTSTVNLRMLPDSLYDIGPLTVTIPKGQKTVRIPVTLYTNKYNLSYTYALPLSILSTSDGVISGNFSTVIFRTIVKNKWDGLYNFRGHFTHPTASYTGNYTRNDWPIYTFDATSNYYNKLGKNVYFTAVLPRLIMDESTPMNGYDSDGDGINDPAYKVTIANNAPGNTTTLENPAAYNRFQELEGSGDEPFEKTFFLYFDYIGASRRGYDTAVYHTDRN